MEVDDPLRLPEPLGVALVGGDLGLGHVHAEGLEGAGHGAGAAAAGADDEDDPAFAARTMGRRGGWGS
ncbi:hypothetical protein GCM10027020_29700 [Nocardioides salsibiostraticola]